jgi:predicted MFS family arabinose efflux permease
MDVPARQAYVVTMVEPGERVAASAYTNSARYVTRPLGPVTGGALMEHVALAGPFVGAGALKIVYDLALYRLFKGVEPPDRALVPEHRSDAQS